MSTPKINFESRGGYVLAIIQHAFTRRVIMVARMTIGDFNKTLETELLHCTSEDGGKEMRPIEKSPNNLRVYYSFVNNSGDVVILDVAPAVLTVNIGLGDFKSLNGGARLALGQEDTLVSI